MTINVVYTLFKSSSFVRTSWFTVLRMHPVQGGRRRGRQKKRWENYISEWTGLKFCNILRKAENKIKWRERVAMSVAPQRSPWQRDKCKVHAPFIVTLFSYNVFKLQMSIYLSVSVLNDKPCTFEYRSLYKIRKKTNKLNEVLEKEKKPHWVSTADHDCVKYNFQLPTSPNIGYNYYSKWFIYFDCIKRWV